MKLKYQMRGLGIGMVVTAVLMGVATSHGIPLTDAEIMARASELGMVESSSLKLSDVGTAVTPGPESGPNQSGTEGSETEGPEKDPGTEGSETEGPEKDPGTEGSETEGAEEDSGTGSSEAEGAEGSSGEAQPGADRGEPSSMEAHVFREGDMVVVVIESGMDSFTISQMLAEAGLVEDAGEFDNYLCDNAYSRKIVNGTYEIPAGTGEEEIAKIITRDR